jgi:uncharacterized membrane-anchored protein
MFLKFVAALAAVLLCATPAAAQQQELTPEQKAELQKLVTLRDSLKPVRGSIPLPAAKATLDLGAKYYFLGPEDARKVLVQGWGNPPDSVEGVLGLVFPEGKSFLDDTWGAVVTYQETDYVTDKDANSADYDKLMAEMKATDEADNAARKKAGYNSAVTLGWAQPPTYDAARHDLIWAREIQFGDQQDHTLNYDVRHLGRRGVLSLNVVSTMSQLGEVKSAAQALARTAEFDAGSRYADFKKGDAEAGYGLAGLVAAGAGLAVAKKVGLIAIVLAFAKKGIAIILALAAGGFAWFRRMFGKKPAAAAASAEEPALDALAPEGEQRGDAELHDQRQDDGGLETGDGNARQPG